MPYAAVDAILEVFTWVGLGLAVLVGLVALVAYILDGSWVPVQAVIADEPEGAVARWFGHDGEVGSVVLTPEQRERLAGRTVADVFVRLGARRRLRLTRSAPVVRFLTLLATGSLALGLLSAIGSLVLLFLR